MVDFLLNYGTYKDSKSSRKDTSGAGTFKETTENVLDSKGEVRKDSKGKVMTKTTKVPYLTGPMGDNNKSEMYKGKKNYKPEGY